MTAPRSWWDVTIPAIFALGMVFTTVAQILTDGSLWGIAASGFFAGAWSVALATDIRETFRAKWVRR